MRAILRSMLLLSLATSTALGHAKVASLDPPSESEFTSCHRYPDDKRFKLSARGEVGLEDLVSIVAEFSCQTILLGPGVAQRAGKVTLEVPDLVTTAEVYRVFHSALEAMGLTVERSGKVWKVIDAAKGHEHAPFVDAASEAPSGEEFVTRLLRVEHASAAEVADVLGKLRTREGDVAPYPPARAIVITDRASSVRRMEELARVLDVDEPDARIWTLAVHGQTATELSAAIEKVLEATRHPSVAAADKGPVRASTSLVPVDSARTIVVIGDEAAYHRVLALAERLDPVESDGGASQVHVLYLAHTNADDMLGTLRDLGMSSRGGGGARPGAPASGGASLGEVRLGADKVANAIVVFANGQDFLMVRDLVAKLDLPRRQVYVEAAVLDLSTDVARQVGVSWHGGDQSSSSGTTAVAASGSSTTSSLITDAASLASLFSSGGLTTGVFGQAFTYNGVSVPSFGVVLKALESTKNVNVISQPHLLTLDNTKATLSVGQSIPFPTQTMSTVSASTTPALFATYQRQDVSLRLDLTPHLHDGESVRLEIDGEISDVPDGQSGSAPGGPTTNKRTLKTVVVVNDGETVVLGGLEKDAESERIEKVPFLGDIPILGWLFRSKTKQRTKQNLMIALTPYVVRGPEDLRRIFERKMRDQDEFVAAFGHPDAPSYVPPVDYKRARSLLSEIRRTALQAEHEAELLHQTEVAQRHTISDGEVR